MNKYYIVQMSNGDKYGIPPQVIAKNRADYYANIDPGITWQEEYDAMMQWFDQEDYEFADWAKGNMDWSDVAEYAVLMKRGMHHVDLEDCWVNGDHEYYHG